MKIILLGTGTPILELNRQHSAVLIEIGNEKFLFDCGRGVTMQLARAGILSTRIDSIFITHHHYDHICDLGEFLMTSWHNGHDTPFFIYGPPGTSEIVGALLEKVFARDINFALFTEKDKPDIRKLVKVKEITSGLVCGNGMRKIFAERVEHGHGLGISPEDWPCFGFRIEAEGKVIAISGDAVECEGLNLLAQNADCLIQCCYLAEAEIGNPMFETLSKHIIASSGQAGKIAAENNVKKLILTHIRPKSQAMLESLDQDIRQFYEGELIIGQDLMMIEI